MFFIRLPESGTKVIQLSICNKLKSINIGLNPINSSFFVCNFDIRCVRKQFGLNKLFLFFFFFLHSGNVLPNTSILFHWR